MSHSSFSVQLTTKSIEETLDAAGPMHFELTEFGFRSGPKGAQKTSASGVLEARRSGGKLPETELTLSAQLPEPVLEIVDTIVRGARPDARGQSVKRFMTPKDLPEGRVMGTQNEGVSARLADSSIVHGRQRRALST